MKYNNCKKNEINNRIYFVFYYNEENIKEFDKNKGYYVERIIFNPYLTEAVFNIELKPNEVQLFKVPIEGEENRKNVLFTSSPFSILFLKTNETSLKKYFSNLNLYYYFQNDNEIKHEKTLELYFIL